MRQLTEREHRIRMEELERRIALEKAEDMGKAAGDALVRRVWAVGGSMLALIVATVSAIAWGQGKIDAGVAPLKADIVDLRKDVERKLDLLASDAKEARAREDKRWEAILWRLKINDPAPTPKDGGQ